jgi:uncharacterized membrane protein YfcA
VIYAAAGFAGLRITVARSHEVWLAPLVGVTTGLVTGATGVFVIPAVPYLQSIGLEKEELIQRSACPSLFLRWRWVLACYE